MNIRPTLVAVLLAGLSTAPVPAAANTGTCTATAPSITLPNFNYIRGSTTPTIPVTTSVAWTSATTHQTITVDMIPAGSGVTLKSAATATPLAYTATIGGVVFGDGTGTTTHISSKNPNGGNVTSGNFTFTFNVTVTAAQDPKVAPSASPYTDSTLKLRCSVS